MATAAIFICYRRDDTAGHAGRIYDRLVERFGKDHVFRDVDTISVGEDFVEAVRRKINQSDSLLVLMGPHWLTAADEEGRWRLADENDLVRVEIATALSRNLRVIPVLLQGAAIPKAKDLPGEIAKLAQRNAIAIRDTDFDLDISLLIEKLRPSWKSRLIQILARRPVYAAVILLLASLLGYWVYLQSSLSPENSRVLIVQMGMSFDANTFVERAEANDLQAVELFLRAGMAVDAGNDARNTALQIAAAKGHFELVKKLIASGADVNRALSWAAGNDQKSIVEFMLDQKPEPKAINQAFYSAAGLKTSQLSQLLLEYGADVNYIEQEDEKSANAFGATALTYAAILSNRETVQLLLKKGADVNGKSGSSVPSALFAACSGIYRPLNSALVDLLIAHGAEVNVRDKDNSTPLHQAIGASNSYGDEVEQERLKIIQSLLDKGADLTVREISMASWQPTPLLKAIRQDNQAAALLLIAKGANVNDQAEGEAGGAVLSALMQAVEKNQVNVVKALLEKGADVNLRNEEGGSALFLAVSGYKGEEITPLLLAAGADPTIVDHQGRTIVMEAARADNFYKGYLGDENIKHFIKAGVNVNAVDNNGWTALMHAARSGQNDLARLLLKQGAKASLANDEGENALAIASKEGNKKFIHLLKSAKAS